MTKGQSWHYQFVKRILILATVLGVGALPKLCPSVFDAIKLLGGAYLAYLGI